MKTNILKTCILLLFLGGCKKDLPLFNTTAFILIDRTDGIPPTPTGKDLVNLAELDRNPFNGAQIALNILSDIEHGKWDLINIESENELSGNRTRRKLQIQAFERKLDTAIQNTRDTAFKITNHSIIYKPVAESLEKLKQVSSAKKVLIIASNLYENSSLSFYSTHTLACMKKDPKKIYQLLEEEAPLPDLTGIQIIFLNKPKSYKDNNNYSIVSGFYKKWFESKNAQVSIQSQL